MHNKRKVDHYFQTIRDIPERNPGFAKNGKARFLAQAKLISASPVTDVSQTRRSVWNYPFIKELKMGTIATIMVILGLLLGGSSATVLASQNDLPNEFLYPVKLVAEGIQSDLTSSPQAKLELNLQFAERRLDEILKLKSAGLMPPEAVFARLEWQINQAIAQAAKLGQGDMETALLRVRDTLQTRDRLMDQEKDDPVLLKTRTILQQRIHLVESGITDPDGFYNEARNGWENTPNMGEFTGPGANGSNNFQFGQPTDAPAGPDSPQYGLTSTPGSGYGPGPSGVHTPTPGSSYGPGPSGSCTPTPGSSYGPGPSVSNTPGGSGPKK